MHAEFQACGSQEYRGVCMELNETSTQSESPLWETNIWLPW